MTKQEFETLIQRARLSGEDFDELKAAVDEALTSLEVLDRYDGADNES